MEISETTIKNVLTRTSGYLKSVSSHSLQPYCGCSFGNSLCGVGCYVRHNGRLLKGRPWGGFLEVRTNAADSYRLNYRRESLWARDRREEFSIFCSSSTDPFVPQDSTFGVTRSVLEAMCDQPPDLLIVQTHTHRVADYLELLADLSARCRIRVHVSIETDAERMPGLPPHASSIAKRFDACSRLQDAGLNTVVTVSPLLPIRDPEAFFGRIAEIAGAVVIDHFIEGDGTSDGSRTLRTALPTAIEAIDPNALTLEYRARMVAVARRHLPDRVGVGRDGFAGRYR